jgi:Tol biopolymer transport system component
LGVRWIAPALLLTFACGAAEDAPDIMTDEAEIGSGFAFGRTKRVSVSSNGTQGDLESSRPSLSRDGDVVAFVSSATNLVLGDTNGVEDIFVHDQKTGQTERVSVSSDGTEADLFSDRFPPVLDRGGRFVAFESLATNLVSGDTNDTVDIFLRDRRNLTTVRVSVGAAGAEADSFSTAPAMSADARYIAFVSNATNLVAGDTNGFQDVFVRDRRLATTSRVSVATNGAQGNDDAIASPAVSDDGRTVVFATNATNLTSFGVGGVVVRDRRLGTTTLATLSSDGVPGNLGGGGSGVNISSDGRFVAFDSSSTNLVPNDTNGVPDVFVRDLQRGRTERVSVSSAGAQGNGTSALGALSADGRFVAIISTATNFTPGVPMGVAQAYLHDRQTGTTRLATRAPNGSPADHGTLSASLSKDGSVLALWSLATNLVPNDTNGVADVFVERVFSGSSHRY